MLSENREEVRILGVDPGLATAGYGLIVREKNRIRYLDSGEMKTKPTSPFPDRLLLLGEWIEKTIRAHKPDIGVLEETFHGNNPKTALQMGHARGALLLTMARCNFPCYEYSARSIKKSVVGRGNASKEQVLYMVRQLLSIQDEKIGEHASDALAAAICHANHYTQN